MSETSCDIAIVGGGIIGLATALALSERVPRLQLAVLEKESRLAAHQSSHNSGVIHAGIYYTPGSYKACLCVEGVKLMLTFCDMYGIQYERCGKVIVATSPEELPRLAQLYKRGVANGVAGLERIGPERVREIEPHANALAAIYLPATGIVDFGKVSMTMASVLRGRETAILTGARVGRIVSANGGVVLETASGTVRARALINCAGLYADRVARLMGVRTDVRIIPFRGEYYNLVPDRRHLVRGLIYPAPDPAFPFLGVHFTRTIHGGVEAGPNAVLAFAREGYTFMHIRLGEVAGMLAYPGFWRMAARYWRMGLYELYRSLSRSAFVRALQRLVPEISPADLEPGGAGVRAQAVEKDGALVDDFRIVETPKAIHVLNAPSPAATASLAIGRHIADLAARTLIS
ncbi:MAG: L-2-hydroxyglutarate oxidase [candidate division NC10 bacterium]|nr:L-2-hydroxyglutarate oxidase [candidate division NC10 bacterium]